MATLHNDVFDNGLSILNSTTGVTENLYICSAEPTTFIEASDGSSGYKLGTKAAPTINSPTDRTGGGREAVVAAITDGTVDKTGTATHYALTDDSATKLLATGTLSDSQSVTQNNTFTLTQFAIGIPDPA